jgi:septal ring factor EnvC (AmiA/AmiB activator)
MRSAINLIVILLVAFSGFSQKSSEKLKKEQDRLEAKIANTKMLLQKSQSQTTSSLQELQVLQSQIKFREQLLRNYDNQIRSAELKIQDKEGQVSGLQEKIKRMKVQYKKLLVYAYKHRNKFGKMMYIFSSESYYEAIKRSKYLKQIAELQRTQFERIKQNQLLITEEIKTIDAEKTQKLAMLGEKKLEKLAIEEDKKKQEQVYQKFKQEEATILAKLRKEEEKKEVLRQKIDAAIRREIAEAEAKRKREEEARRKREAAANKAKTGNKPAPSKKPSPSFEETKEAGIISKKFEGNKGRLPWPVSKGTITEGFGKNPHPTLKEVYTNNNGIDISAPRNAQVRAVFDGEVTSVLNIPGAGKVVIIKHGNYRTVYSNLKEVYVSSGDKIRTKKAIGSLLSKDGQDLSIAHFEIHKVDGTNVSCLNPSLWIAH